MLSVLPVPKIKKKSHSQDWHALSKNFLLFLSLHVRPTTKCGLKQVLPIGVLLLGGV